MPRRELNDAELERLVKRAGTELLDVPEWVTQRALGVWRASSAPQPGPLARLVALLRFDSWQAQATPALRSGAGAAPRQLLFSVGDHDIDLRVHALPGPDGQFQLAGQVLGPAATGWVRWQCAPGPAGAPGASGEIALDEMGEFVVDALAAGPCRLTLQLGADEVALPEIDVRAAPGGA